MAPRHPVACRETRLCNRTTTSDCRCEHECPARPQQNLVETTLLLRKYLRQQPIPSAEARDLSARCKQRISQLLCSSKQSPTQPVSDLIGGQEETQKLWWRRVLKSKPNVCIRRQLLLSQSAVDRSAGRAENSYSKNRLNEAT